MGTRRTRMYASVLLLVILLAPAGEARADRLWVGFHGGPSVPSLEGGTNEVSRGYTSRLGPYFGVFADYHVRPNLALRAEINYSSEGGKRNGMQPVAPDPSLPVPDGTKLYAAFDNEAVLDYVVIPVMAKLGWGETTRFFVKAGPYVGFLVKARTVTSGSSLLFVDSSGTPLLIPPDYNPLPEQDFGAETDIKGDVNSSNFGLAGGIGVEIPYGPGNIVLDAHVAYGLTNIQRDTVLNGENNTGSLAFTIGYSYLLGGGE